MLITLLLISLSITAFTLTCAALGNAVVSEKPAIRQTGHAGQLFFWAIMMNIFALTIMFFVGKYS